jgi:hypothetical protein
MSRVNSRPPIKRRPRQRSVEDILQALIAHECDAGRLTEICHLARQPGLLEIVRAIVAMPEGPRAALEAFLAASSEREPISADWDTAGRLILNSLHAAKPTSERYDSDLDAMEIPALPH